MIDETLDWHTTPLKKLEGKLFRLTTVKGTVIVGCGKYSQSKASQLEGEPTVETLSFPDVYQPILINANHEGNRLFDSYKSLTAIGEKTEPTPITECNPTDAVKCDVCGLVFHVRQFDNDGEQVESWDEVENIPRFCPNCGMPLVESEPENPFREPLEPGWYVSREGEILSKSADGYWRWHDFENDVPLGGQSKTHEWADVLDVLLPEELPLQPVVLLPDHVKESKKEI